MKWFLFRACLILLTQNVFAQEKILNYHSDIEILPSGSIIIQEEITVRAEGDKIQRGIFRDFPIRYKDRLGNNYHVSFEVIDILRDGNKEPYRVETKGNGKVLYIGKADVLLDPGTYKYTLIFESNRQLGHFDQYDELYFNAVGGGWDFVIDRASVEVKLTKGARILNVNAFTGLKGATSCNCEILAANDKVTFLTNQRLNPGEQFTVAVSWPKGFVNEPTFQENAIYLLSDNKHILTAFFGLAITFMVFYNSWKKVGKDPEKGTIIPRFEAPEGFTAACARFLMRMGFDQKVFTATLVNMAVKGYLTIESKKKGVFSLTRTGADLKNLATGEKVVATVLFKGGDEIILDNKNHRTFSSAISSLNKFLQKEVMPGRFKINFGHTAKGLVVGIIVTLLTATVAPSPLVPIVLGFFILVFTIVFYQLMKAPSIEGRKIMDEIEGFKKYLSVTEKNPLNLRYESEMTPAVFEELLPYAIALGVENDWTKKFESRVSQTVRENYQPRWYQSYSTRKFNTLAFSSTLGRSFSSAISSASTPPGSSSGTGGGGSSGGGGGGGGGGGW